MILVASIGLALAACARSPEASRATPSAAPAALQAATPSAAPAELQAATPTCQPPLRLCTGCTGKPLCARLCPECPAPAAPQLEPVPATLALAPDAVSCGGTICAPGTFCCNPSCGICTPKGVNCTQQSCN